MAHPGLPGTALQPIFIHSCHLMSVGSTRLHPEYPARQQPAAVFQLSDPQEPFLPVVYPHQSASAAHARDG